MKKRNQTLTKPVCFEYPSQVQKNSLAFSGISNDKQNSIRRRPIKTLNLVIRLIIEKSNRRTHHKNRVLYHVLFSNAFSSTGYFESEGTSTTNLNEFGNI